MSKINRMDFRLKCWIAIILVFGTMVGISCSQEGENFQEKAIEETRNWQSVVQAEIQVAMDAARDLEQSMVAMKNEGTPSRDKMNDLLKQILEKYPNLF